jgi:hypothetical protein
MSVINSVTDIQTQLENFAFKSIELNAATLPPRSMYTLDYDDQVAQVGQIISITLPDTIFGSTANDLSNGWGNLQPSSSQVTAALAAKGYDHPFNITTVNTIGEAKLLNAFGTFIQKQAANNIFVDLANLVSSSYFTNVCYVNSSSLFNLTGSLITTSGTGNTGLQSVATQLDEYEVTTQGRYAILNPVAYQGILASAIPAYFLGSPQIVRGNGYVPDQDTNQSYRGVELAGFNCYRHPRINTNTAKLPYGGSKYTGGNVLAGWAGASSGLVLAARPLNLAPAPLMASVPIIDPTSGFPLTYIMSWDTSLPGWRLGTYSLYGVAAGNPNAISIIISAST